MIQILLHNLKMDPLVSLHYYAPVCAIINLFFLPFVEGLEPFYQLKELGILVLVSNAAVAFLLNVAAVFLVGVASSLVLTLSGVFKVRLWLSFCFPLFLLASFDVDFDWRYSLTIVHCCLCYSIVISSRTAVGMVTSDIYFLNRRRPLTLFSIVHITIILLFLQFLACRTVWRSSSSTFVPLFSFSFYAHIVEMSYWLSPLFMFVLLFSRVWVWRNLLLSGISPSYRPNNKKMASLHRWCVHRLLSDSRLSIFTGYSFDHRFSPFLWRAGDPYAGVWWV